MSETEKREKKTTDNETDNGKLSEAAGSNNDMEREIARCVFGDSEGGQNIYKACVCGWR